MSFWRRFLGEPKPTLERSDGQDPPLVELERALADPGAADRARTILRELRGTALEGPALDRLQVARSAGVAELVLVTGAELLAERGDSEQALEWLAAATSPSALLLRADLLARRGELARALTLVERVLARDIDMAGARERHERYRKRLGWLGAPGAPAEQHPTILAARPATSLRIVGEAGRGGAGTVYEAVDDVLGRPVAFKVYHHPERDRAKLEREAKTAVRLAGPGVVRIFDIDPNAGWLTMAWAAAGALKGHIRRADASFLLPVAAWWRPLLEAMARVHAAGWVHADVKPANVLMAAPGKPVVSDFGAAKRFGAPAEGGSLGYVSPERIEGGALASSDDVFALGRILEDVFDALGPAAAAERVQFQSAIDAATGSAAARPTVRDLIEDARRR